MALTTTDEVLSFMGLAASDRKAAETSLADMLVPAACALVKEYVGGEIELATFTEYYPESTAAKPRDELVDGWDVVGTRVVPRSAESSIVLRLKNLPVRQVDTVFQSAAAWDTYPPSWPQGTTLLTEGVHYRVDYDSDNNPGIDLTYPRISKTGFLICRSGAWMSIPRSIKVTYKAGYTEPELILSGRFSRFKMAAMMASAFFLKEAKLNALRGGNTGLITARTIDGYSQTYAAPAALAIYGLTYDLPPACRKMLENDVNMSRYF